MWGVTGRTAWPTGGIGSDECRCTRPSRCEPRTAEWTWDVAWEWPEVATTWRLERPSPDGTRVRFLKVVQTDHYPTALDESARTQWASLFLPVPIVLDSGSGDGVDWLLTDGVDRHRRDPSPAARPTRRASCRSSPAASPTSTRAPRSRSARSISGSPPRSPHARERVRAGIVKQSDLHPEFQHLSLDDAVAELERLRPASEDLVVCHGDYCFPNVLLDDAGAITGYLDLGELGDRRPVVGRRDRRVEHDVERRPGLGGPVLRGVRHRARRRAHHVLPPALRARLPDRRPGDTRRRLRPTRRTARCPR